MKEKNKGILKAVVIIAVIISLLYGVFTIDRNIVLDGDYEIFGWKDGNISYTKYVDGEVVYEFNMATEDFFTAIESINNMEGRETL